jgi:M6 family metalloprotease domain
MNFFRTALLVILCAVYCMADYSFDNLVVRRMPPPDSKLTQGDVRVLVVLVEFSDVHFTNPDPVSQFTDYLNKEGYNEYYNIGSVRDYFIKNSMGKFKPTFDVYGPVTLPGMQADYGGGGVSGNSNLALSQALDLLLKSDGIDFLEYDNNGDGVIDYAFMIYAGESSSGSNLRIWPHAGYLGEKNVEQSGKMIREGLFINFYACVNEIDERAYKRDKSTRVLSVVGLFIHEFSHLLGLCDLYVGVGSPSPITWSVMLHGSSSTPPLYSAFERMSLGWLTPTELKTSGKIQLNKLEDNVAYSITNPENPDEMYLLEYRTNKGWDIGQENSGMLIWHIDYDSTIWKSFKVNDDNHMHVDIVEAAGSDLFSSPSDVFPGSENVTEFKDFVFWNGLDMNITLSDITESPDKEYVTFNVTMGKPFRKEIESSSSNAKILIIEVPETHPISASSIAVSKTSPPQASVISQNGTVHVTTPLQGLKKVRMFSLNGQLLFETFMDGSELQFPWPRHLGAQNVILFVSQGKKNLYMGIVNGH